MVDVSGFSFASLEHSFMVYLTADLAACSAGLFREWWLGPRKQYLYTRPSSTRMSLAIRYLRDYMNF